MNEEEYRAPVTRTQKGVHRWGIWVLALILMIFAACIVGAWKWKSTLSIAHLNVEGTHILASQQVVALSGIVPPVSMFSSDFYAVRKMILAQPFIRSVDFCGEYPDNLSLQVTERQPIASVNNGSLWYIDADGTLLPYLQTNAKLDLPMISGIGGFGNVHLGGKLALPDITEAIRILQDAQEIDSSLYHFISEVNMNGGGDITLYSGDVGVPIYLGRDDIPKKLLMLQTFWSEFVKSDNSDKLKYVDLRFDDQVVVRWQNDNRPPQSKAAL